MSLATVARELSGVVAHAALVRSPVYHPDISATTLYQEDLQVIVPANHPLAAKRPLLTADLNDHPMISHDAGSRGGPGCARYSI